MITFSWKFSFGPLPQSNIKSVIFGSTKHKAAFETAKCFVIKSEVLTQSFHDVPSINVISSSNDEPSSVYTPLFLACILWIDLYCHSFAWFVLSRKHSSDKLIISSSLTRFDSRLDSPYSVLDSRLSWELSFENHVEDWDSKESVNLHLSGTVQSNLPSVTTFPKYQNFHSKITTNSKLEPCEDNHLS